jgi:DNA/RNA-binding domain of Phe-tRNA-synthetase-like protein
MHKISIDENLKQKVPALSLFAIECDVTVFPSPEKLLNLIGEKSKEVRASLKTDDISRLPAIHDSRCAYKAAGKDPARYRLSAEALLRRIVRGDELYLISNVVDLLNLVSISTGFSIGGYDASKINGDIEFGIGMPGELYSGINRGSLNIDGLPVFRDLSGAFGTPTSDSERTCVDGNTSRFLMIIVSFGKSSDVCEAGSLAISLLKAYANAVSIETNIIHATI